MISLFLQYKTEAIVTYIPNDVSSGTLSNLTLSSGITLATSLMLINSSLLTVSDKTTAFNDMRLDVATIRPDLEMFVITVRTNLDIYEMMEISMGDSLPTMPPGEMDDLEKLLDELETQINMLSTAVTDLPTSGLVDEEVMLDFREDTKDVLVTNDATQTHVMDLLMMSVADAELMGNMSAILKHTVSALHDVIYMVDPPIHTGLIRSTNNQVVSFVDLMDNNAVRLNADTTKQLMRDVSQLTANIMNLMLTTMHNMNSMTLLNLDEMVYSLTRLTGNVLYFLGPDKLAGLDVFTNTQMILKDMSTTLADLSTLAHSPSTLDLDDIMEMNKLTHDINMLLSDLTDVLNVGLEYAIFHESNTTDTKVVTYVGGYVYNMNIMGLVVFSIAFGIVLGNMDSPAAKTVVNVSQGINDAVMLLVLVIMW